MAIGARNSGGILELAISPDSQFVAAACDNNSLMLWDIKTGVLLKRFISHGEIVRSVGFSPDGCTLVSGSLDNSIMTWEIGPTDFQTPTKHMQLHRVSFKLKY